jgi:hypothetical protein
MKRLRLTFRKGRSSGFLIGAASRRLKLNFRGERPCRPNWRHRRRKPLYFSGPARFFLIASAFFFLFAVFPLPRISLAPHFPDPHLPDLYFPAPFFPLAVFYAPLSRLFPAIFHLNFPWKEKKFVKFCLFFSKFFLNSRKKKQKIDTKLVISLNYLPPCACGLRFALTSFHNRRKANIF